MIFSSLRHAKLYNITAVSMLFFISSLVVANSSAAAAASCSKNVVLVSTGLRNLGNTCYLNAQLQCAYHIPKVRNLILHADDNKNPPSPALQALRLLFQDMTTTTAAVTTSSSSSSSSSRSTIAAAPVILCQTLGIPVYQQQDSQEFWKLFLPALQYPALTDLYQGSYQDTITALDGSNRQKRREEVFLDLSLDLIDSDNNHNANLQSSLQQFVRAQVLSVAQGNGWRPQAGADKIDAKKGIQLFEQGLPSILQLHLKRFQFDWNTETTTKLNLPFEFTKELDLTSLVCRPEDDGHYTALNNNNNKNADVIYDLQAVIIHMGEYDSGHYYAYVRPDVRSDVWYRFNDEVVTRVTLQEVLEDSIGGLTNSGSASSSSPSSSVAKKGFLARLFGAFSRESSSGHYGFGGRTSNAYVLQYIRRRDIPTLYDQDS